MQIKRLRMGWCYKKTEVEVIFFCWYLFCWRTWLASKSINMNIFHLG